MMRENKLKKSLRKHRIAIGPFLKFTDPAVVEIIGHAGFDFVIIDTEHGPISIETAQNLVRAAEGVGITSIIRVTENNPGYILRALDIGAQGVEVPHISSKKEALKAVQAVKFFPSGERGVCRFVRAAKYSALDRYKYFEYANRETMIILHIEGQEGIENLDEILSVDEIDVLFIGPYDLSQSLGIPGQVDHPDVVRKMKDVIEISKGKGVAIGTFVDDIKTAKKWIETGIQYISFSVDAGIFYEACRGIVQEISLKSDRKAL